MGHLANLWFLPGERLEFSIVVEDGKLNGLSARVESHCKLRLTSCVGNSDQLPPKNANEPLSQTCEYD